MKEATKRAVEPPHASKWPAIRRRCDRLRGTRCVYPWCNCTYPGEAGNTGEVEEQGRGIKRARQKESP